MQLETFLKRKHILWIAGVSVTALGFRLKKNSVWSSWHREPVKEMGVGRYELGVLDMGQSVIWIRYASTVSALNLLSSWPRSKTWWRAWP